MYLFNIFRRRTYDTESKYIGQVCYRLDGDFVPDDQKRVVSCIAPKDSLSFSYFAEGDYYVLTFVSDPFIISVSTPDRPNFMFNVEGGLDGVEIKHVTSITVRRQAPEEE